MTYEMIISQVAKNLGWDGFSQQYIKDIKFAIYWSLMELSGDSGALKNDITIPINSHQQVYLLPEDLEYPRGIVITSLSQEPYQIQNVEYDELTRYSANPFEHEFSARYNDRILYAFDRVKGTHEISIYPAVTGTLYIHYDSLVQEDLDIIPAKVPAVHRRFQMYIIDGATYYLARRELSTIAKERNPDLLNVFLTLVKTHQETFEQGKKKYSAFSMYRSTPPLAKAFNFYDKPEEY